MPWNDNYCIVEGRVIERRSHDRNSLQRVECGVTKRAVIGLFLDWASDQGSLNGNMYAYISGLCNKAKDVCGKSSAHLDSVQNLS